MSKRILIVEPSPTLRSILVMELEREEYQVVLFEDYEWVHRLEWVRNNCLPNALGPDCTELKEMVDMATTPLPFVLLTAELLKSKVVLIQSGKEEWGGQKI